MVGYLAQERRIAWGLSALAIAELGALTAPPSEARERAMQALTDVGLAHLADRGVFSLSGGERARVLLARLLASRAPLLVLDEPIAGLDPDAQLMTLDLLKAQASAGVTVVRDASRPSPVRAVRRLRRGLGPGPLGRVGAAA